MWIFSYYQNTELHWWIVVFFIHSISSSKSSPHIVMTNDLSQNHTGLSPSRILFFLIIVSFKILLLLAIMLYSFELFQQFQVVFHLKQDLVDQNCTWIQSKLFKTYGAPSIWWILEALVQSHESMSFHCSPRLPFLQMVIRPLPPA